MADTRHIDQLARAARSAPPALTFDEARRIVEANTNGRTVRRSGWALRLSAVAVPAAVCGAIVLGWAWFGSGHDDAEPVRSSAARTSAARAAVALDGSRPEPSVALPPGEPARTRHDASWSEAIAPLAPRTARGADRARGENRAGRAITRTPRRTTPASGTPSTIAPIATVRPERATLDSLGITIGSDGTIYFGHDTLGAREPYACGVARDGFRRYVPVARDLPPAVVPRARRPMLITDETGKRIYGSTGDGAPRAASNSGEVRELMRRVDSMTSNGVVNIEGSRLLDTFALALTTGTINTDVLIPVLVDAEAAGGVRAIFWYAPSGELLRRLPSTDLVRLNNELVAQSFALGDDDVDASTAARRAFVDTTGTLIDSILAERMRSGAAVDRSTTPRTGSALLDILRVRNGAIEQFDLVPSAPHTFTVRLRLAAHRTVTIALFDARGEHIVATAGPWGQGSGEMELRTKIAARIPPGMYRMVISTNKGEQTARRCLLE